MNTLKDTSVAKDVKYTDTESKNILDDLSLSDNDDSFPFIECDICNVEFSSVKGYEQHLKGKKHHKMVNKLKIVSKVSQMNKLQEELPEDDNDEISDNDGNESHCEVCEKSFSGHVPYYAHLKSSVHLKMVKKQKLKDKMKDLPEVLKKENGESEDEDMIITKPFARCKICEKEFSGPEPFHQHMKSSSHKKKCQQKSLVSKLQNDENDENVLECEVCDKSFSGFVPYHIHMNSGVHRKEVLKAAMISEIKDFCKPIGDDKIFICKECEKHFTDPFALKAHVESNDHEKQKAKKEILEFLSLHPEIMMVKAVENNDSDDDDADSIFFVCKICHVSLSGPESAKSHVRSRKHVATKKERKALKDIKLQRAKNNASDKKPEKENAVSEKKDSTVSPPNDETGNEKPTSEKNKIPASENDGFELL